MASSRPSRSSRSSGAPALLSSTTRIYDRRLSVPGEWARPGRSGGYCPLHTPGYFRARAGPPILVRMSGFVVDSRTLLAVRDTLGRLNEQLVGMHTVIWHQWGTLGGVALESELEHFCGTWHYGVTELGGQLQDLTRRLGEAAQAYERIEQRITQAGGGSTPTSATGAGHAGAALTGGAAHHATAKHHAAAAHHAHRQASRRLHGAGRQALLAAAWASLPRARAQATPASTSTRATSTPPTTTIPASALGTTVIPPGPAGGSHHAGGGHHAGSGSGVTVIGGGPASRSRRIGHHHHRREDPPRRGPPARGAGRGPQVGGRLSTRIQRA